MPLLAPWWADGENANVMMKLYIAKISIHESSCIKAVLLLLAYSFLDMAYSYGLFSPLRRVAAQHYSRIVYANQIKT